MRKIIPILFLLNLRIFSQETDVNTLKEKNENIKKQIGALEEEQKKINE